MKVKGYIHKDTGIALIVREPDDGIELPLEAAAIKQNAEEKTFDTDDNLTGFDRKAAVREINDKGYFVNKAHVIFRES